MSVEDRVTDPEWGSSRPADEKALHVAESLGFIVNTPDREPQPPVSLESPM